MAKALNESEKKQINLTSLQKEDKNITDILGKASHVVIYKFDNHKTQWIRIDVEGSAFIVTASVAPFLRLLVLNRLSRTPSLYLLLTPSFHLTLTHHTHHTPILSSAGGCRCQYLHLRSCSSDKGEITISISYAETIGRGMSSHSLDPRAHLSSTHP